MSLRTGRWWCSVFVLGLAGCAGDDASTSGAGASGATSSSGGGEGGGASTTSSTSSAGGGDPGCVDSACPPNQICGPDDACVDGCSTTKPCEGGLACCEGSCVDTTSDLAHCGACGDACEDPGNIEVSCGGNTCVYGACTSGFDCDGIGSNGCESATPCFCEPGDIQPCYEGEAGTLGVGVCAAGQRTCLPSGLGYGTCDGQVLPAAGETCGNGLDDDCDGVTDYGDQDGDGYDVCSNDCCDNATQGCGNPELVNPGAFEVEGNQVDDDCDGTVDNGVAVCDGMLVSNSSDAMDYARAIDLCKTTTEVGTGWGLISASFARANGAGSPSANARSIRTGFGNNVMPLKGSRIAVLSTGHAAAQTSPNNTSPNYAQFQGGVVLGTDSAVPADWLAANGNNFPNAPGCPEPQGGTTGRDTIQLKVRVRAPSNANSFSVKTFFYSSEYPEFVCSPFNDFFLTLLDSSYAGMPANPADKNLAFYTAANMSKYPLGVNLAYGNTGLFRQCKNGATGCATGAVSGNTSSCVETVQLVGTGFDILNPASQFPADPGYCGSNNQLGGGTGWLTTSGNVVPGEVIELRFVLWDTGDGYYDSVVLLDDFSWSVQASQPGTKG